MGRLFPKITPTPRRLLGERWKGRPAYRQVHTLRLQTKGERRIYLSWTGLAWEVLLLYLTVHCTGR